MHTMEEWCKYLKIPMTEDQIIASRYAESRGLKAMVDFGYGNVIAKADRLFDLECEKAIEVGLLQ